MGVIGHSASGTITSGTKGLRSLAPESWGSIPNRNRFFVSPLSGTKKLGKHADLTNQNEDPTEGISHDFTHW